GTQFVFLDGTLDEKSAGLTAQVSFLLVTAEPGVDVETVRAAIEARLGSARAWPTEAFVDRNLEELLSGLRPFLVLVAGMSVISATLLVELLVQGAIDERRQELAVLLALGVPLSEITVAVLIEAGGLALMGSLIGAFVALGMQGALDAGVAALDLHPTALDAVWVGLGLIASSAVGGLIPMLRLRRIDPGEAFRP
ncbi:MAG: ABC transporter permease, partial [Myxococcota bacterium]